MKKKEPLTISNPIICAIDTTDIDRAISLTNSLKNYIGAVKLGLEFFTANGGYGVRQIAESGVPIFLDLKFHDIPNTVYGAVKASAEHGAFMVTVHTTGGADMLKAAVDAANEASILSRRPRPLIMGVTVPTSMDDSDLTEIGVNSTVDNQVIHLASLARDTKLDGCICSAHEIGRMRDDFGHDLKLAVPGIRPRGSDLDDQKRIMTPDEAINQGADYLIIGRPITKAKNPVETVKLINERLGIVAMGTGI